MKFPPTLGFGEVDMFCVASRRQPETGAGHAEAVAKDEVCAAVAWTFVQSTSTFEESQRVKMNSEENW